MREDWDLYVLRLQGVKDPAAQWYVGITTDYEQRMKEHYSDRGGSEFTRRNEVLEDYRLGPVRGKRNAKKLEHNLTRILVREFGVGSTRGGKYLRIDSQSPPDESEELLHPGTAQCILGVDDRDLHRILDYRGYRLKVKSTITVPTIEDGHLWADSNLPKGASYEIEQPERVGSQDHEAIPSTILVRGKSTENYE